MQNEPIRVVDTREYVSMLRDIVRDGKTATMIISGNSMAPFLIHHRDRICFAAPDRALRRGDIVFYERESGQFVCHRIVRSAPGGYYLVGDNQTEIEGPVRGGQIFARITRVERKGRWISSGDFWWDFFEKVWIRMIPLRNPTKRLFFCIRRIIHRRRDRDE